MKISDKCNPTYSFQPSRIVHKIIDRIPNQYTKSIEEIIIFDSKKRRIERKNIVVSVVSGDYYKILVDMSYKDFSGIPFFSILIFNLCIIEKIVEINRKTLESADINTDDWMYLGVWQPANYLMKIYNKVTKRNRFMRWFNESIDKIIFRKL